MHNDGLMQERRNFSALEMELRLSCINSSTLSIYPDSPKLIPWYQKEHLHDSLIASEVTIKIMGKTNQY